MKTQNNIRTRQPRQTLAKQTVSSNQAALSGDLGGRILSPGIYEAAASVSIQSGNLMLDAHGNDKAFWIFKIFGNVTTIGGAGGNIVLAGGAQAKHIFWLVGQSIQIGEDTLFQGNITANSHTKADVPLAREPFYEMQYTHPFQTKTLNKMKTIQTANKGIQRMRSPGRVLTHLIVALTILFGTISSVQAQETESAYTPPSWWFGVAAGANLNYYRGTTQQLTTDFMVPKAFLHGDGLGLYLAPSIEFHKPESKWGFILQAGYDNRKGAWDQVTTPCNCPADLSTDLAYITVEPSLRFAPSAGKFYLYAGPRFAFTQKKAFHYEQGVNPDLTNPTPTPDVKGNFGQMESSQLSFQIGAGLDMYLSSPEKRTQTVLSPFVAFHPYFGQFPRKIETWNVNTLRIGAVLKFGKSKEREPKEEEPKKEEPKLVNPVIDFSVNSPENIPVERRVRETFPLRNYVFFDLGSTEVPDRYVLLRKDQVADFKEDQLEVFTPKRLSGRSDRQMIVYYNVLNILGDRMNKSPKSTIRLTGASLQGAADARAMAQSVKNYLNTVWSIDNSRMSVDGRERPSDQSGSSNSSGDLKLMQEGERRVTIESAFPELLLEFQSGPEAPLKPVEIMNIQTAPLDSYVTFNADGAKDAFTSWSLEVKDEAGKFIQTFGPYYEDKVSIPGKTILGTRPSGNYTVTMIGNMEDGRQIRKEAPVKMALWTPAEQEQGMRYSVIFEFNESETIALYEKYLTEIVTPKIPQNGTVIIHGYTDIIGNAEHNQSLSLARANAVRTMIEKALAIAGRKDVKFELHAFGENTDLSPFANEFPEERFYNRTVVIDIIPAK